MFIEVAIPLYLENLYTYSVPKEYTHLIKLGLRIIVPLGKSKIYTGVVVSIHHDIPPSHYEIKPIIDVLEDTPSITEIQIKHWKWIADYYMCSFGEVLNAALPFGLKIEGETIISTKETFDISTLNEKEIELYDYLRVKRNDNKNVEQLIKDKNKSVIPLIKSLLEKDAVEVYQAVSQNYKPKLEKFIALNPKIKEEAFLMKTIDNLSKSPKQREVFLKLLSFKTDEIKYRDILKMDASYSAALKQLFDKEIIDIYELAVSRFGDENINTIKELDLSSYQLTALNKINECFLTKDISLLYGVTSSGKTEVYMKLIQEAIENGKQVLYMLPEIALTTQIIQRLKRVFGGNIGVYHSKYNYQEKTEVWNRTLNGEYKILIGARSSIFLPFKDLGIVIVDEEHDSSFKQKEPSPRYNAKASAIMLAKLFSAKVLLGSATPSIESYQKAISGDYGLIKLDKRYSDIELPLIQIVDTKPFYKKRKMKGHFSPTLYEEIERAIASKSQVILFQNRRGYSPYVECTDCGHIPKCKKCSVSLTHHKALNLLKCHYCGYVESMQPICSACGNPSVENKGFGTEMLEEELSKLFPKVRVLRMDIDTTSRKNSYQEILEKFEDKEVDILVGTQMITKGLNFDNVSLVGILNADNLLFYPDFRAHERAFQTLMQVSGRAGRKHSQGKVLIQTSNPENEILKQVLAYSFQEMYNTQLEERKMFKYPPFVRLIEIFIKHKDLDLINYSSQQFADNLRSMFGDCLLGPVFPMVSRIKNLYIKKIMIKIPISENLSKYKSIIKEAKLSFLSKKTFRSLNITIDVDPF